MTRVYCKQEFDGASRGNPGPAGAGASLFEHTSDSQVCLLAAGNAFDSDTARVNVCCRLAAFA